MTNSSSSSISRRIIHDDFLSFRGEDTRHKLVDHLYDALSRQRGIRTFRDDEKLRIGEEIGPSLSKSIEESWVWIVVLSPNYANSRWCLDELVKILDCNNSKSNSNNNRNNSANSGKVYPVFYEVDPSDVRNQSGVFGEGFNELASRTAVADKVEKWKLALKEVADLKGSFCYLSPTLGR